MEWGATRERERKRKVDENDFSSVVVAFFRSLAGLKQHEEKGDGIALYRFHGVIFGN